MGLNICLARRTLSGTFEHSDPTDWDWTRYARDREFSSEVLTNDNITESRFNGADQWYYRPKDVAAWKEWDARQPFNNGRWAGLADILERDPELWVYVSW